MKEDNIKKKFNSAAKWSASTEIAVKLVSPITNMILARVISPEAFGVVATITMVMSFADMFTDAGFQKYLVQHEFKNEDDKLKNANVAFWTNLGVSAFIWIVIIIFREQISTAVGNPGLGDVIAVSCVQLLLTSFSSIQMALYRRDFNFKTLFLVRMVSVFIPFIVTIPLAFMGFSYWALISGNIVMQLSNAFILTIKSKWKPNLFYDLQILKKMFSFSMWTLIESISIWFTAWVDIFIIGNSLNQYYLGIYKTSTTMVNSLMALITSSIVPVLFSALSRLQKDDESFKKMYLSTQRFVAIFIFPLGIGVYLYRNLATTILLGDKWMEASDVIGIWALTSAIMVVFGNFCSEIYRAKGMPHLSFLAQILHLIVLIPTCIFSSKYGFWTLVYARSWIRLEGILVHFIIMHFILGISSLKTFKNVIPIAISSLVMGVIGFLLQYIGESLLWNMISIVICIVFYFGILCMFPNMRKDIHRILVKFKLKANTSNIIKRNNR
ncbi:lipopolysaccharide biosynthesis protein [Clostridium intestinale]|uniref:Polysaccharide biosynthesis protein n=1 Tax=Clostridium intestinale URNW TaxID=1294142 RepID=U2Q0E2_9CLOT|nr:lipopolysaccharide biosynthesis protein [Clostridium intestinale]ERK32230.1 polysaccharide biosynthesis protein [Clostridium intestinale URNW]